MRLNQMMIALVVFALTAISCDNSKKKEQETPSENMQEMLKKKEVEQKDKMVYEADISALNADITGSKTNGKARFVIEDNKMKIRIEIKNAPPGIEHWQHFHGFADGTDAKCPTKTEDKNDDGIIDLIETEAVSGTTMVPFNDLPADMEIPTDTYPVADEDGNYIYEKEVSINDLSKAFAEAFDGSEIHLEKRVLYIHGVPEDTQIPKSVESLGPIPAHTTLPIACGKIKKVQ